MNPYHKNEISKLENNRDAKQLRLLSIFHYVVAGIAGLFSLFPLIHLAVGVAILSGWLEDAEDLPRSVGWLFIVGSIIAIVMGLVFAICVAVAGRNIKHRTGHLYCLIVAGFECLLMPFGTVLGVLTIIVLLRPSVETMFGLPDGSATHENDG